MYHDYLIQREIQDLQKFALFETASIQILEKLFKHMKKIEYKMNKTIYKEKDQAEYLYFIKSG
jgi:CRP-like cAMP-binding protein